MGGEIRRVSLSPNSKGEWNLDLEKLFSKVDDRTQLIFVNSPGNPTGWMMEQDQQQAVLDFCRERGSWIVADEVYGRLTYDRQLAPSFL